ncbi:MAG TPA: metalloregulator ArsR/SmtB family transcription factor [Candidatus Limnocylindrales bacterium]|nr:metalloregulator ArsR/SmtB family transcription factor [Candidatus Limnocylindrales bacterium]
MNLDATYSALAHDTRRRLVQRLSASPGRVTELAADFPISLAAVSRHIGVLEEAGLVRRRIVGRDHFLSLEPVPLAGASEWLDGYRQFWEQRLDLLDAHLRKHRHRG